MEKKWIFRTLYVPMAIPIHIHTRMEHMGHIHTRLIRDKTNRIHGHLSKLIKYSINWRRVFILQVLALRRKNIAEGKWQDIKFIFVSLQRRKHLPLQIFRDRWKTKSRLSSWYLFESVQFTVRMVHGPVSTNVGQIESTTKSVRADFYEYPSNSECFL